jgi:hypothetical protein
MEFYFLYYVFFPLGEEGKNIFPKGTSVTSFQYTKYYSVKSRAWIN